MAWSCTTHCALPTTHSSSRVSARNSMQLIAVQPLLLTVHCLVLYSLGNAMLPFTVISSQNSPRAPSTPSANPGVSFRLPTPSRLFHNHSSFLSSPRHLLTSLRRLGPHTNRRNSNPFISLRTIRCIPWGGGAPPGNANLALGVGSNALGLVLYCATVHYPLRTILFLLHPYALVCTSQRVTFNVSKGFHTLSAKHPGGMGTDRRARVKVFSTLLTTLLTTHRNIAPFHPSNQQGTCPQGVPKC